MKIRYTASFLAHLEALYTQAGYQVRYEKGNFKSGYCILNTQKIVVVNKYYTVEGKINCLMQIIRQVDWDFNNLAEKEQKIYEAVIQSSDVS